MTYIEIISLSLTPFVLALCAVVIWDFVPPLLRKRDAYTATDYLIAGIAISFLGKICDNLYWWIPWISKSLGLQHAWFWFDHGLIANIPFRQGSAIAAGLLHLYASYKMHGRSPANRVLLMLAAALFYLALSGWMLIHYDR